MFTIVHICQENLSYFNNIANNIVNNILEPLYLSSFKGDTSQTLILWDFKIILEPLHILGVDCNYNNKHKQALI